MDTSTMAHGMRQGNPNKHECRTCGDTSEKVEWCFTHAEYVCDKKECHDKHSERVEVIRAKYGSPRTVCYWHRA